MTPKKHEFKARDGFKYEYGGGRVKRVRRVSPIPPPKSRKHKSKKR